MVRIILLNGRNMVMEKFIMIMVLDFTVQKTKIWPKNGVSVRIKMVTQIDMRLKTARRILVTLACK